MEFAEMRKISQMARWEERKHIKESNYSFANKWALKISFPTTAVSID
jgi:hypothetical protein